MIRCLGALAVSSLIFAVLSIGSLPVGAAISPAATANPSGSVSVQPFFQDLTLQPDQIVLRTTVQLINASPTPKTFSATPVDLRGLDESGGLLLVGQDIPQLERKYGLINWLSLERNMVVVPARGSVQVPIIINNRSDLAPGGHYAVIIFREEGGGSSSVGVHQAISEILLLRKIGGEKYGLSLAQHLERADWWTLPRSTTLTLRNSGNVHIAPRGLVTLKAPGGKVIRRGIINPDSATIFPGQSRKFSVELAMVGSAWWPGVYHLSIDYRYDGSDKTQSISRPIYHLGAAGLFAITLILISIATFVIFLRRRRR